MGYQVVVRVVPGDGYLCRRDEAVLFVGDDSSQHSLLATFEAADSTMSSVAEFGRHLASDELDLPPFVFVHWGESPEAMLFGDLSLRSDHPSLPLLNAAGSQTWIERRLPLTTDSLTLEVGEEHDPVTHLRDGVVRAGGFSLVLTPTPSIADVTPIHGVEPRPVEVTDPSPTDDNVDANSAEITEPLPLTGRPTGGSPATTDAGHAAAESADPPERDGLTDPGALVARLRSEIASPGMGSGGQPAATPPARTLPEAPRARRTDPTVPLTSGDDHEPDGDPAPGPHLDARRCPGGHPNPPTENRCRQCGKTVSADAEVEQVPRPRLGSLILDDDTRLPLDTDLAFGRAPDAPADGARVRQAVVTDGERVSRLHFEVCIDGWDVSVVDAASTNGTWLQPTPDEPPYRLDAGVAYAIAPGALILFGTRRLRYDTESG